MIRRKALGDCYSTAKRRHTQSSLITTRWHWSMKMLPTVSQSSCGRPPAEQHGIPIAAASSRSMCAAASVSAALSGAAVPLEDASSYAAAIRNDVQPDDTPGLRADTKLHMATVLTRRALNSMVEARTEC